MELTEIIKRVQRRVAEKDDGLPGIRTWTAIAKAVGADLSESATLLQPEPQNVSSEAVDARSELSITTLHRKVQPIARRFVRLAAENGITIRITSGTRTYAEQDALFNKHDGTTKARGGQSNHNFGLALDVTIFKDGQPVYESPKYQTLGKLGKSLGLSWGGDWESFQDEPHFQLEPEWANGMSESQMLSELRKRHDQGRDAFA